MNSKNTAIPIGALIVGCGIFYGGFQAYASIQDNRASATAQCLQESNTDDTLLNGRSYYCKKVRDGDFSKS